jgi:hypothetical protein
MITELLPWIEDGIRIDRRREGGYKVFTIPTQHFDIKTLDELTSERFELEVYNQDRYRDMLDNYYNLKGKL